MERSDFDNLSLDDIRVLIADDHKTVRSALDAFLLAYGMQPVGEAANGVEAVAKVRNLRPDIILMDLVMPEMDGIELAQRATELAPGMRVMFITGFAAVALNADSTAPKHAKVLSKPIHLRDLVNEVHKMLAA